MTFLSGSICSARSGGCRRARTVKQSHREPECNRPRPVRAFGMTRRTAPFRALAAARRTFATSTKPPQGAYFAGEHLSVKPSSHPHIAFLELHRPSHRNALSKKSVAELEACLASIAASPPRALVVHSSDPRAFCAGADLKERATIPESAAVATTSRLRSALTCLSAIPTPSVAAVAGPARGGGAELALACDVRVVGRDASFALPEALLGIIPGAGGTQRLPRAVGAARALEMIWSGRAVCAEEAVAIGLAQFATEGDGCATERAVEIASGFARAGPRAVALVKRVIVDGAAVGLDEAMEVEWERYLETLGSKEREEGIRAFNEKRTPEF